MRKKKGRTKVISFIIIGRNEGWKITKCLQSVFDAIAYNNLIDYEVIYVDSNSTDDSVERVLKFKDIKIFKITSKPNPAIGRNIGAQESNGESLFFIDGDMEIMTEFLHLVYDEKNGLKYNYLSGQFKNYYYNDKGKLFKKESCYNLKKENTYMATTGGLFLIKKELWNSINGMRNKYKTGEDLDMGLRLAKKGFKILRKKDLLAKHHTIQYVDKKRFWKDFFKGSHLYARSMIYRDHILNKHVYKTIIRSDYSLVIMIILGIISLSTNSPYPLLIYVLVILLRSIKNSNEKNKLNLVVYYILRDVSVIIGFLFFFPKETSKDKIQYILIKSIQSKLLRMGDL